MSEFSYNVYCSREGNVFMAELAAMIADSLRQLGRDVMQFGDGLPAQSAGTINLVVAPHEFFALQPGYSDEQIRRAASESVCVCTEQPGTPWFELTAGYAAAGPVALDINRHSAASLHARGVSAVHLQLGYHQSMDRWGGGPLGERPLDLVFLGGLTPRRDHFLAASAPMLWDYRTDLRLFEFDRPVVGDQAGFLSGDDKFDLLARSKVLLNVHRSSLSYFEWVRVLEAMSNGCVVVSETSTDFAPLVPFQHFLQAPLDALAGYACSILSDDGWREEIAADAYEMLRTKLDFVRLLDEILPAIEHAGSNGSSHSALPSRRQIIDALRLPPPTAASTPPERTQYASRHAEVASAPNIRAHIKELILAETSTSRAIEALQSVLAHGSPQHLTVEKTRTFDACIPDVTVIISLYNYAQFIGPTIDSVIDSYGVTPELIVVDDHSSDGSRDATRAKMSECPWYPIALVSKAANEGLSKARNTGFELARAEYVFVLDADNVLYPCGLAKLARALDSSDAGFAYGVIERFEGDQSLMSCLPWDVERLTLGNYIDAMTMVRRSIWQELGGYDADIDVLGGGWEDYEFWLRMAAHGYRGEQVRQFVARYRCHGTSMLSTVNIDTSNMLRLFRERYPFLPWPPS